MPSLSNYHVRRHPTAAMLKTMKTENSPQFRSKIYEDFAKKWEFNHATTSPYNSQSNGKSEATVKIVKRMLKKVSKDHTDIYLAVVAWWNTPTEGVLHSPAQKFHSHRIRILLPSEPKLTGVVKNITQCQLQYDKHAKPLGELQTGQTVRI